METRSSIAFHTLGCKLNFSETSTLSRKLDEEGYARADFKDAADVYVINTCSVTENADRECRQLIRRVKRQNPNSTVVITGCYAQLQPEQIAAIEGVDLVIDQLSGTYGTGNLQACKVLGRIVNVGRLAGRFAEFDFDLHALQRISYIGVTFRTRSLQEVRDINEAAERDLGTAIAAGQLVLPIDRVFAFDDLAQAFEHMRTNQHFGKIVIAF